MGSRRKHDRNAIKATYAILCVLGTLLPYSQFGPWLSEHGLALDLIISEVASSRVSSFAWLDVLVSAAALLVFMAVESRKTATRHVWLPVVGLLSVGVSLALPLFLLLREMQTCRVSPGFRQ